MNLTMAYSYHPGWLHHFMTTLRNEFTIVRCSAQCQVGHSPLVISEPIRDVIGKYDRRLNFHIQTDECWIIMLHRDIHSCLECWNLNPNLFIYQITTNIGTCPLEFPTSSKCLRVDPTCFVLEAKVCVIPNGCQIPLTSHKNDPTLTLQLTSEI